MRTQSITSTLRPTIHHSCTPSISITLATDHAPLLLFPIPPCPPHSLFFFFLMIRRPPSSPLFPYTTLFRSWSSSSMGCGVTRGRDSRASSGMLLLDVQVDDFFRVFLDVLPARFDRLAHQDRKEGIGGRRILNRHLLQDPARGIHGRLPEFIRVHLAQALVALVGNPLVAESLRHVFPLLLRVRIVELLALLDLVQGWLRDVDVASIEERTHVTEEQGEEERRDMLAIHVCVGHRDDLVIPDLRGIELLADARADRGDEGADLLVFQHLIHPGLLDIQDLPAEREDRLELAAASLLCGPPCRRA